MNRLTSVNYGDGLTQSYTFDPMGNRLTMTDGQQHVSTYNNANMLLTLDGNPYTNDFNGNTLAGGGRTNTWDSQNRLRQCVYGATVSQFTYGSDGLRRTSNVNGTIRKYILDNGMMVRETDANGVSQATYLAGLRGPEYRRDDVNGSIKWYVFDGLGSVLAEMDGSNGTLTASRKLDVYGAPRATQGTPSSKHAFVGNLGHTTEPDTGGLVYMRARWMDPVTGTFLSEDPARDGANWFAYCGGDPVNRVDADGRRDTPIWLVIGQFGLNALATATLVAYVYSGTEAAAASTQLATSVICGRAWLGCRIGPEAEWIAKEVIGPLLTEIKAGQSAALAASEARGALAHKAIWALTAAALVDVAVLAWTYVP